MATMRIHHALTGTLVAGTITAKTTGLIQYRTGTITVEFRGYGFEYEGSDYIIGGTLTSFTIADSANGGVQLEVSGFSRNVVNSFGYLTTDHTSTFLGDVMRDYDTVHGSAGNDVLDGWAGGDVIYGGAGDDTFDDNDHGVQDSLIGGPGDDTYIIERDEQYAGDAIAEYAGEGTDWVLVRGSYALPDHVEHLEMFGEPDYLDTGTDWSATGNALDNTLLADDQNNLLQGMAGNDHIEGGSGNDTLDGGAGADALDGGAGDDVYIIDLQDVISDSGGFDTIVVPHDGYQLTDTRIEQIMLARGMVSFTSGATPDRIVGGDQANTIDGGAGNDILSGGKGNDTIVGGAGADSMEGGQGIDTFYIDNAGDVVNDFGNPDLLYSPNEQEFAFSSVSYDMRVSPLLENLYLVGSDPLSATGNQVDNLIVGNDGDNRLIGSEDDTLFGGLGNDTLVYTKYVRADGDAGVDTVEIALPSNYHRRGNGTIEIYNSSSGLYDTLVGVDVLKFTDRTVVVNSHQATGQVGIGGTAMVGRTVQATASGVADGDGLGPGALAYQWYRGHVAIVGATASTYALTADETGASLRVRVRFIDGQGNTESLWSAAVMVTPLDTTAPLLVSPAPNAPVTVVATENLILQFDEDVVRGAGTITLKKHSGIVESFDVATSTRLIVSGATVVIDPSVDLAYDTNYTLQIGEGTFRDLSGNAFGTSSNRFFETNGYLGIGTAGADVLLGLQSPDHLQGLDGNDTLTGGSGNDTLDGGNGVDTAVIATDNRMTVREGNGLRVYSTEGADLLIGVERVRYPDAIAAYDTLRDGPLWDACALLWAGFGQKPDRALLSEWVRQADAGLSLEELALAMLDRYAPQATAGGLVAHLYEKILGGTPSAATLAHYSGEIGQGRLWDSKAEFLAFAAAHDANTVRMVGFVGSVETLDPAYF